MPVVVARPRVIRRRPAPMSEDEADAIQRRVKEAERSRERRQDRPPNPNKDGFGEAEWDDQKHVWISRQEGDNPQIMTWDSQKSIWQTPSDKLRQAVRFLGLVRYFFGGNQDPQPR